MSNQRLAAKARRKGMAVVITGLTLVFVIPIIGLAIDAGVLYVVRAKLTAACDAASLATARNLNLGVTLDEQIANAKLRGEAFFRANFPNGFMGAKNVQPVITVAQTSASTLSVTTTATGELPFFFTNLLGNAGTAIGILGKASRRDVNLMLVLDRSGSMSGQPCSDMKEAAKAFTDMFVEGRDRLGLVVFNGGVYLAYPPTKNFRTSGTTLRSVLDSINCTGTTNAAHAYATAYNQLVTINEPLALNLTVFFTDGVPNGITANYPIRTQDDTRYGESGIAGCSSPHSECQVPKSSCNDDQGRSSTHLDWGKPYQNGIPFIAPKLGSIATSPSVNSTPRTGSTYGLYEASSVSTTAGDSAIPSSQRAGCALSSNNKHMRRDIAFIPESDVHGNATTGYKPLDRFASGPYASTIRPDEPLNVANAGINLLDNAAARARNDTRLYPVSFTIGLDGNGGIDETLLKRMANDPQSPVYDQAKQPGLYVYAANSAELHAAFARVASEALRLAQ